MSITVASKFYPLETEINEMVIAVVRDIEIAEIKPDLLLIAPSVETSLRYLSETYKIPFEQLTNMQIRDYAMKDVAGFSSISFVCANSEGEHALNCVQFFLAN